jgi:excisionase family DNA binding protein
MEDTPHNKQALAYTVHGVCEMSGFGRTFIFEKIKTGELPARKAGRRTIILHDDLVAWLNALPLRSSLGGSHAP